MALLPILPGAVNVTVACVLPTDAVPIVGAPGTDTGVTAFEDPDAVLLPMLLLASTLQVTLTPSGMPDTLIGDADPLALKAPQVAV